jgi:hypothetical protein
VNRLEPNDRQAGQNHVGHDPARFMISQMLSLVELVEVLPEIIGNFHSDTVHRTGFIDVVKVHEGLLLEGHEITPTPGEPHASRRTFPHT